MTYPVTIVDDFFSDPDAIVEMAESMNFYNPNTGEREINLNNLWQFVEEFRKNARDGSGFPTEFRGARTLYDEPNLYFTFLPNNSAQTTVS